MTMWPNSQKANYSDST